MPIEPFGDAWTKRTLKMSKKDIVSEYKKVLKKNAKHLKRKEHPRKHLMRLVNCIDKQQKGSTEGMSPRLLQSYLMAKAYLKLTQTKAKERYGF